MGLDLNRVLFGLGVAVSPFDLASLVTEVAKERQKKKDKAKTSIIGTLIEDAMMEFTSLEETGKSHKSFQTLHSTTSSLASRPLDTFEDVQDWAADLNIEPVVASTGSPFAAGNLAALEDHPSGRPMQPSLPPMTKAELLGRLPLPQQPGLPPAANLPAGNLPPSAPQAAPAALPNVASMPTPLGTPVTTPEDGKKPMSGAVKALVAALVVAAAVAGSYVSGLL